MRCRTYVLMRCRTCKLVFVGNPPDLDELRTIYSFASGYDATVATDEVEIARRTAVAREFVAVLPDLQAGHRLLDVGASAGFFVQAAISAGWEASGVELSADAARTARERYGVDVVSGRLQDVAPSIPHSSLDVVTMWDVLEHVLTPREDLELLTELLRTGGYLVLSTPNIDGLYPRVSGLMARWIGHWPAVEPPWHLTQFSVHTLSRMLEETGFRVISVRHVRIPLSYSFGTVRQLRSVKRLCFAVAFAPLALIGPWVGRGDEIQVVARLDHRFRR